MASASYGLIAESWNTSSSSESSGSEGEDWQADPKTCVNLSAKALNTSGLEQTVTSMITIGEPCIFFQVTHLNLSNNILEEIPEILASLTNLQKLDVSNNRLIKVSHNIAHLSSLTQLILKNNQLSEEGLPKDMLEMRSLRTLNLSGNELTCIPPQLFDLASLRNLFLGANKISQITPSIIRLRRLRQLYLGGNRLETLPTEIGELTNLQGFQLSDNRLRRLPESVCNLRKLQCLHLHKNNLSTLPHGLIHIRSLSVLSLRENPLVMRFIRDMEYQPASLLEIAGRTIRTNQIPYKPEDLPASLFKYLKQAHECVNPNCEGVYFDHRVEHVKFSDFCGKYKVPLLQYLCSPRCREQLPEYRDCDIEDQEADSSHRLKRVLLG